LPAEIPKESQISRGGKRSRVQFYEVSPDKINVDLGTMQNRSKDYDETTYNSIRQDVKNGNFDLANIPPVMVYKDGDGKLWTLNHSRLKAYQDEKAAGNKDFSTIPVQEIKANSLEEAGKLAREKTNIGAKETPIERAKLYRKDREDGLSENKIIQKAKQNEGKNSNHVLNISHLNPKGDTINAYNQVGENVSGGSVVRDIADYIGQARSNYPQLTDAHENELFKWLYDDGQISKFNSKLKFLDNIDAFVNHASFEPNKPIGVGTNKVVRGSNTIEIDNQLNDARKRRADIEKERKDFEAGKALLPFGLTPESYLSELTKKIANIDNTILDLTKDRRKAVEADKLQDDLFSQISEEMPNERAEEIISQRPVGEFQEFTKDIESKAKTPDRISTPEITDAIKKSDELIGKLPEEKTPETGTPRANNPNDQILKQELDFNEGRSDHQKLQDRKKHLELAKEELSKIPEDKISDYYNKYGKSPRKAIADIDAEIKSIDKTTQNQRAKESQLDIFGSTKQNQESLFQKEHNHTKTFYEGLTEKGKKNFIDEISKGVNSEWLIGQENLSKEQAAGLTDLIKKSILYDPKTADITTAWEESLHASMVTLAKPFLAKSLLRENGWDGKGDIWDVKSNQSLRESHETLAKKYIEWRDKQENDHTDPKTRTERLFQSLRELWAKTASYLNRIGFTSQAGYFYDLAKGKLREQAEKISNIDYAKEIVNSQTNFGKSIDESLKGKLKQQLLQGLPGEKKLVEYKNEPKDEIEKSLLKAYNGFDNSLPSQEKIISQIDTTKQWSRQTQYEETKRVLGSFLSDYVKRNDGELISDYIRRALKAKPELQGTYDYLRTKLYEAVKERQKDENFLSDYKGNAEGKKIGSENTIQGKEENRIISEESYLKAKNNLRKNLAKLNAGIDPTNLKDLATIGAYHVEGGLRNFADWGKKMIEDLGDRITPYLLDIWRKTKKDYPHLFSSSESLEKKTTLPDANKENSLDEVKNNAAVNILQKWIGKDTPMKAEYSKVLSKLKNGEALSDVQQRFVDRITKNLPEVKSIGEKGQPEQSGVLSSEVKANKSEEPAEDQSISGISQRVREARADLTKVPATERGIGWSGAEALQRGRDLLRRGETAEGVIDEFKKSGKISDDGMAIVRARNSELQKATNEVGDAFGVNSKEYKDALKKENDFLDNIKPMQTQSSRIFTAQQGGEDIDTGTYTGLVRAFTAENKTGPTEAQSKRLKELATENKYLNDRINESEAKAQEYIRKYSEALDRRENKEPSKSIKIASKELADKIRNNAKIHKPGIFYSATPASLAWDLGVEAVAQTIEKGGALADAIQRGVEKVKETDWYKSLAIDKKNEAEKQFRLWHENETKTKVDLADLQKQFVDKKDFNFTPQQRKQVWQYAKDNYIDKGQGNFQDMVSGISKDLGLSPEQVRRIIAEPKTIRDITDATYKLRNERQKAVTQAKIYIRGANTPAYIRLVKNIPNAMFGWFTFGHGTVFGVTHAGMEMFKPTQWATYFPAFLKQFKFAYGNTAVYEKAMTDLKDDPNFIMWKRTGLAVDPERIYDDYRLGDKYFGKVGLTGERGFNAWKIYRLEIANKLWGQASEIEKQDPNTAKYIADFVNHSTGTSNIIIPDKLNTAFFAPRLEASRWARIFVEPAKALKTFIDWDKASAADKFQAKLIARKGGEMLATYSALLAANQAMLSLSGSSQSINFTNPMKTDWMRFKAGGKVIDVSGGMLSTTTFLARLLEASIAPEKDINKLTRGAGRSDLIISNLGKYARGKLSPFGGTAYSMLTRHDYAGNTLPPFDDKPLYKDAKHLSWGEYLGTQMMPIPISEGVNDVMQTMKNRGMSSPQIETILNGIFISAVAGGTGARVRDEYKPTSSTITARSRTITARSRRRIER
jgi:hypothetical protein